eukprot:TRINITY_DN1561_c0_g1_i2.p1 TRINITY_DN1561_c0_g1~~TRINITY_DN1561_c0_g1_i2.p1  ORF type:complete len:462 (-),score=183.29 TRINITY_DN1561_c0_g1_i2:42-1427(-)
MCDLPPPPAVGNWGDEESDEDVNNSVIVSNIQNQNDEALLSNLTPSVIVETLDQQNVSTSTTQNNYISDTTFEALNLMESLLKTVYEQGFSKPSIIQATAIPLILANPPKNLIAQAKTGSGKTGAFLLGVLSKINTTQNQPQGLILCPTRELAIQIYDVALKFGRYINNLKIHLGIPQDNFEAHRPIQNAHLIIATPGTFVTILTRNLCSLNTLRVVILDEADQFLSEQAHKNGLIQITKKLPRGIQMLCFSATFPNEVKQLVEKFVLPPLNKIYTLNFKSDNIAQFVVNCRNLDHKNQVLYSIYSKSMSTGQGIIFCNSKKNVRYLADYFSSLGHTVSTFTSDLTKEERDRAMDDFRKGKSTVFLATNLISRGIDILAVVLIINYDLPFKVDHSPDETSFIHRSGRSGRFNFRGATVNLVASERDQRAIEKFEFVMETKFTVATEQELPNKLDQFISSQN